METKQIKPLHKDVVKPDMRVLGSLLQLIYKEVEEDGTTITSYDELASRINSRFNVEVTGDEVYKLHLPMICEEEAKHAQWYGYLNNFYEKD